MNDAYNIKPLNEIEEAAPSLSQPAKQQHLDSTSPEREGLPYFMNGSLQDKFITFLSLDNFLEKQQAKKDFMQKQGDDVTKQS